MIKIALHHVSGVVLAADHPLAEAFWEALDGLPGQREAYKIWRESAKLWGEWHPTPNFTGTVAVRVE